MKPAARDQIGGMDASKRRRVETDRLGDLPDCLLQDVLSHLGSRQVVRTSILSRRWTHLWRDVISANVVIDEQEFAGNQRESLDNFADHVVPSSVPQETPHLDAFRLNLVRGGTCWRGSTFADRLIRRGLRRVPAAVDIRAAHAGTICWRPNLSNTTGLCTRRVTTLCLVRVVLTPGFLEDLGRYCPALEDLHVESCVMEKHISIAIASPTLRGLVFVEPLACTHLNIAAPRLAHLRLELAYNCQEYCHRVATGQDPLPLVSLAETSIRVTDTSYPLQLNQRDPSKGKLEFLKFMRGFVAFLPNVQKLHLAGFTTTSLLEEEFPVLHSLKTLTLDGCEVGVKLQALTGILSNTPNIEMLGLHNCTFALYPPRRNKVQQALTANVFWCQKLKSIQVKSRQEDQRHLAFNVLSKISEGMQLAQWLEIKTSFTIAY